MVWVIWDALKNLSGRHDMISRRFPPWKWLWEAKQQLDIWEEALSVISGNWIPSTSEMSLTKQNSESPEQDLIQSLLQVHKHLLERTRLVPFSPDQYPSTKIAEKWEIKSSFILKHAQLLKLKHSPRMNFFSAPGVLFSSCVQCEKDLRLDYVILCWEGDNHCR